MQSQKNVFQENVNSANLMFITGPTKSGKSVFLRENMREFAGSSKHKPVVFHFDFADQMNSMVTFDCFLSNFEAQLIETLV